jgi:iron complex transport system ATP-binding protein
MITLAIHDLVLRMGSRTPLPAFCWRAHSHEFWAVLGPNGVGKSSLLKTLAGLHAPQQGRVEINGENLHTWHPQHRAHVIAWLSQESAHSAGLSVAEYVALGAYHRHADIHAPAVTREVKQLLAQWELTTQAAQTLDCLSGGERQRAALAQLALQATSVLLLDEPSNHLDIGHQIATMNYLQQRAQQGALVIAVLHDINLALRYCSHALLLSPHEAPQAGRTQPLCNAESLSRLYQQPLRQIAADGGTWIVPL